MDQSAELIPAQDPDELAGQARAVPEDGHRPGPAQVHLGRPGS